MNIGMPQVNMPMRPQQPAMPPGKCMFVNSYQEIQSAFLPDGTVTAFIIPSEDKMYLVQTMAGQRYVSGYTLASMDGNTGNAVAQSGTQSTANSVEERLSNVEQMVASLGAFRSKMENMLNGGTNGHSKPNEKPNGNAK